MSLWPIDFWPDSPILQEGNATVFMVALAAAATEAHIQPPSRLGGGLGVFGGVFALRVTNGD